MTEFAMYDPLVGRFLEEDPEDFAAGDPNLFRYIGNSPTNATDPSGRQLLVPREDINDWIELMEEVGLDSFRPPNSSIGSWYVPFGYGYYLIIPSLLGGGRNLDKDQIEKRFAKALDTIKVPKTVQKNVFHHLNNEGTISSDGASTPTPYYVFEIKNPATNPKPFEYLYTSPAAFPKDSSQYCPLSHLSAVALAMPWYKATRDSMRPWSENTSRIILDAEAPVIEGPNETGSAVKWRVRLNVDNSKGDIDRHWIVQHVTMSVFIRKQPRGFVIPENLNTEYWELWYVDTGFVKDNIGGSIFRADDNFNTAPEKTGTAGVIVYHGRMQLITMAEFNKHEFANPIFKVGNKDTPAGSKQLSTKTRPPWWKDYGPNQLDHAMTIYWDNTIPDSKTTVVTFDGKNFGGKNWDWGSK